MAGATVHLVLTDDEQEMLDGALGSGVAMAMRLVVGLAEAMGAPNLLEISGAHVDSCLFHGQSGLDFVDMLVERGAQVRVPTTLNVSSLDLLHPELFRGDGDTGACARALMDGYVSLGCSPTWTCAPYQLEERPSLGQHVAWAETNAIVFANSVLGARTNRYGDFIDIAAAITGRVPQAGLHRDGARHATQVVDVTALSPRLLSSDAAFPVIGYIVGRSCGNAIPAIIGLPEATTEDNLKALGAAAASSGRLAMFHAVGLTPEAPTLDRALGGNAPAERLRISPEQVRDARDALSTATTGSLSSISLGTPHYSITEIGKLVDALGDRIIHGSIMFYVSTGRAVMNEAKLRGWVTKLESAGVTFVTDTCTYITPILQDTTGLAMTDSAKWAYYAPGNLGVDVIFGSLKECVDSGVGGKISRDPELWA